MIDSGGRELKVFIFFPENHEVDLPDFIKNDSAVTVSYGIPNFQTISEDSLIFIDDMMEDLDINIQLAWTKYSHHRRLTLILSVQNIFYNSKKGALRNISLNSTHLILTNNKRDRRQIQILAQQLSPNNSKFIVESYNDATKNPFSYLLFDMTQSQDDCLRIRTSIFPTDDCVIIYSENK